MKLPKVTDVLTLAALRNSVRSRIGTVELGIHEAVLYVDLVFRKTKMVLASEWTSFGRSIGDVTLPVGLENLYDRIDDDVNIDLASGAPVTPEACDHWLVMYIMAVYRVCQIDREDYRQIVVAAVNAKMQSRGSPAGVDILTGSGFYKSWVANPWYRAFAAFIDMYLVKNPDHPLAEVRIGTILSRFRDCSALMDLTYVVKILGINFSELTLWIWSKSLAMDFIKINKSNEEVEITDSYTPYMMDLRLTGKSPYSASTNPHFHFWVHVIGTCLGIVRSQNSRIVGYINQNGLALSAMVCGYAFHNRTEAARQFARKGIDPNAEVRGRRRARVVNVSANEMPEGRTGTNGLPGSR